MNIKLYHDLSRVMMKSNILNVLLHGFITHVNRFNAMCNSISMFSSGKLQGMFQKFVENYQKTVSTPAS